MGGRAVSDLICLALLIFVIDEFAHRGSASLRGRANSLREFHFYWGRPPQTRAGEALRREKAAAHSE